MTDPLANAKSVLDMATMVQAESQKALRILRNRDEQIGIACDALMQIGTAPLNTAITRLHALAIDALQEMKKKHKEVDEQI